MSEIVCATIAQDPEDRPLTLVGIDDGYACTKLALADGRLVSVASRGRIGGSKVSWMPNAERLIYEYATNGATYSVGEVDAESTRFEGYPESGLNRAIVQHALQYAGLEGADISAVSGLPVSTFYRNSGTRRESAIESKRDNLMAPVAPLDGSPSADVVCHQVIPEALAAWYDHVIVDEANGAKLDKLLALAPIAVVDIGGRTTDTVVVRDQGILHHSSGSCLAGILDGIESFADALEERFGLRLPGSGMISRAFATGTIAIYGRHYDVSDEALRAKRELVERLHAAVRRQLGSGAELHKVLLVGGGALAQRDYIGDWFPNQVVAAQPEFANARGMLKYLRHLCAASEQS